MDQPDEFPDDRQPPRRPPPLKVNRDSHKIKKPPVPPPPPPPFRRPLPVIIYEEPPVVHHTNPNEFMGLVQRLTGPPEQHPPSDPGSSSSSSMLPPPERQRTRMPLGGYNNSNSDLTQYMTRPGLWSSGPGSVIQQGSFQPRTGPPMFQLPVPEPRPFISQHYEQEQHPDYNMSGGGGGEDDGGGGNNRSYISTPSTNAYFSHDPLPSANSSDDFLHNLWFPQQENDHDHDHDNDNR